jgi:DNA-binding XRE family transcriptional regulator
MTQMHRKTRQRELNAVAQLRNLCGWSQADLAVLIGISVSFVKKIESRSSKRSMRRKLPLGVAEKLSVLTGADRHALCANRLKTMGGEPITREDVEKWWRQWSFANPLQKGMYIKALIRRLALLISAIEAASPADKTETNNRSQPVRLLRLFWNFDQAFTTTIADLRLGPFISEVENRYIDPGLGGAELVRLNMPFVWFKRGRSGREQLLVGARRMFNKKREPWMDTDDWLPPRRQSQ